MWSYYSSLFKSTLRIWCFGTCVVQFVLFFTVFIVTTYLSTLLEIRYSSDYDKFVSEYEKYVVLAIGLYFIIPFAFSNVLLFGLYQRNLKIITIYIRGTICNSVVILILVLGSGIYLAMEGTVYVAYSLIGTSIILEILLLHSILIVLGIREKIQNGTDNESDKRSSTSSTTTDRSDESE